MRVAYDQLQEAGVLVALKAIKAGARFCIVNIWQGEYPWALFSGVFCENYSPSWEMGGQIPVQFDGETRRVTRSPMGMSIVHESRINTSEICTVCLASMTLPEGPIVVRDARSIAAKAAHKIASATL